jgi:tRNA (cmo5U34)-methyltransferase
MTSFEQSKWADGAFVQEYREGADHYIPERAYLFHVLRSYCRHFLLRPGQTLRICDLGCGDAVLSSQLLEQEAPVELTLIDGSNDMLAAARQRLNGRSHLVFLQKTFDELIEGHGPPGPFDLILSGFAIHHLHRPQRRDLFDVIFSLLRPGGHFVNVETALAETTGYDEWYFELWRQWIDVQGRRTGMQDKYHTVPDQARANPDNKYSPLQEQLSDLRDAGFLKVDCHYRNGIFAFYGGIKPEQPVE